MKRRRTSSPKRRLREEQDRDAGNAIQLSNLAEQAIYGGNPEHKRNPGDFGLSPPSLPRQGKSLCDEAGIFSKAEAQRLLKEGFRRGLVSVQVRQGWPQNVWAVAKNGVPLEAMLENAAVGAYHGYPMLDTDPLRDEVIERWNRR